MLKQYDDIAKAMRRHAIEPTVFLITQSKDGKPNGMAAGWNIKLSYEPPMMAVAIMKEMYSQQLIHDTKEFVIAVPAADQREDLEYFGSVSGEYEDKITLSKIKLQPATKVKPPMLADARANFECTLQTVVPVGDHYLFIGEVVAAHYDPTKAQLYYAGRDPEGNRVFKSLTSTFPEDEQV